MKKLALSYAGIIVMVIILSIIASSCKSKNKKTYDSMVDDHISLPLNYNVINKWGINDTTVVRRLRSLEGNATWINHLNLTPAENSIYKKGDTLWVCDNRPADSTNSAAAEAYVIDN